MKSTLDCVPCFVEHALHVAKMNTDDVDEQFDIVRRTLAIISKMELERTPPEMARVIHGIIREVTGVEDAYAEIKDQSTAFAVKLLPLLRDEVAISEKTFETIVRLAIAGNIIDFGADRNFKLETAHQRITETLTLPLDLNALAILKRAMDEAERIFYILDNCGEAVIDRLLIEPYREKITLGIRGEPILNDITPREVEASGLNGLAKGIIDTGDSTPGVSMRHSRPEFLELLNNADLIVSKGQGNFETLSDLDRPIIFLLRAKCHVICDMLDTDKGSLNIVSRNLRS